MKRLNITCAKTPPCVFLCKKTCILGAIAIILVILSANIAANKPKIQTSLTLLSSNLPQNESQTKISTEIPSHENSEPISYRIVQMRVTAYCPCEKCCGDFADRITASGHKIRSTDTLIAADKRYAFGTEMIIPSYNADKPVKVLDRGSAIHGDRIDVLFASHQQALNWGVKYLDVKIMAE